MNKYLVIYEIDGELSEPSIETASDIFQKMDMSDCYPVSIASLYLIDGINFVKCRFQGTWHNPKDPLKMQIKVVCPATKEMMEPLDVGYGTDH